VSVNDISKAVSGKCISGVICPNERSLAIRFTDGTTLLVEQQWQGLAVTIGARPSSRGLHPTSRQREYLEFIGKYISRFGVAPAEGDIQRHFMVSAPSAHQMVVTLERLGFITREMGVARSIRIVEQATGRPGDSPP
jgi:repressor LexA